MRYYAVVFILVALAGIVGVAAAETVTVTVIGPDGTAVSGASVVLIDTAGNSYSCSTDINGVCSVTVPANGTYLAVVEAAWLLVDTVSVSGATSVTLNASAMNHVNVSSVPISVDATVLLSTFPYYEYPFKTNITIYAPAAINLTFPAEVKQFPYKYVFSYVKYDGVTSNDTTIQVDMTASRSVTAHYTKTFQFVLEQWMIILLVLVIVIGIAIAWIAGSRAAASMIRDWRSRRNRFVRKRW